MKTLEEKVMPEKLVQGDRFPTIELALTDGSTLALPEDAPGRYFALLFYRGGVVRLLQAAVGRLPEEPGRAG